MYKKSFDKGLQAFKLLLTLHPLSDLSSLSHPNPFPLSGTDPTPKSVPPALIHYSALSDP